MATNPSTLVTEKQETVKLARYSSITNRSNNGNKIQLTLSIGGMTCATCSGAIEKGLKLVEGISDVLSICNQLQLLFI